MRHGDLPQTGHFRGAVHHHRFVVFSQQNTTTSATTKVVDCRGAIYVVTSALQRKESSRHDGRYPEQE